MPVHRHVYLTLPAISVLQRRNVYSIAAFRQKSYQEIPEKGLRKALGRFLTDQQGLLEMILMWQGDRRMEK